MSIYISEQLFCYVKSSIFEQQYKHDPVKQNSVVTVQELFGDRGSMARLANNESKSLHKIINMVSFLLINPMPVNKYEF